jgi:gas vesicle protein
LWESNFTSPEFRADTTNQLSEEYFEMFKQRDKALEDQIKEFIRQLKIIDEKNYKQKIIDILTEIGDRIPRDIKENVIEYLKLI